MVVDGGVDDVVTRDAVLIGEQKRRREYVVAGDDLAMELKRRGDRAMHPDRIILAGAANDPHDQRRRSELDVHWRSHAHQYQGRRALGRSRLQ
jgi:hypothetical protein